MNRCFLYWSLFFCCCCYKISPLEWVKCFYHGLSVWTVYMMMTASWAVQLIQQKGGMPSRGTLSYSRFTRAHLSPGWTPQVQGAALRLIPVCKAGEELPDFKPLLGSWQLTEQRAASKVPLQHSTAQHSHGTLCCCSSGVRRDRPHFPAPCCPSCSAAQGQAQHHGTLLPSTAW